ncbi:MAG: hypothetical protein QXE66_02335 [Desulfurococcaceae archaeon]
MKYRVVVKVKETGEIWFDDTREALSREHALKMMQYHIEQWKLEEIKKNPDAFEIEVVEML